MDTRLAVTNAITPEFPPEFDWLTDYAWTIDTLWAGTKRYRAQNQREVNDTHWRWVMRQIAPVVATQQHAFEVRYLSTAHGLQLRDLWQSLWQEIRDLPGQEYFHWSAAWIDKALLGSPLNGVVNLYATFIECGQYDMPQQQAWLLHLLDSTHVYVPFNIEHMLRTSPLQDMWALKLALCFESKHCCISDGYTLNDVYHSYHKRPHNAVQCLELHAPHLLEIWPVLAALNLSMREAWTYADNVQLQKTCQTAGTLPPPQFD